MKVKTYIRYFLLVFVTVLSMILFSYTRNRAAANTAENESCDQKQSEFVIWGSLSHDFLGGH